MKTRPDAPRTWETYARQVSVAEIGPEGQARVERSEVRLEGEPSIVETARLYLERAGVGRVGSATTSSPSPCRAVARIGPRRIEVAAVGRTSIRVRSSAAPSVEGDGVAHAVSDATLRSAGLLLAVESLKACLGISTSGERFFEF